MIFKFYNGNAIKWMYSCVKMDIKNIVLSFKKDNICTHHGANVKMFICSIFTHILKVVILILR